MAGHPDPTPEDLTPSFHASQARTPTQPTPQDYVPPTAPGLPQPDDAHPPAGGRFTGPAFHRKGGMGRVFVAVDSELNRRVAVKDIQPRHRGKDWYRQKFLFEAEVTGELEHPGIVPVYGFARPATAADHPHYAMRFLDGHTLGAAILEFHLGGPHAGLSGDKLVKLRRLLAHFITVCQTIAYAHSRGIIHRDLKPDNVMLGPFGETLVLDWGLAKRLPTGETAPKQAGDGPHMSVGGGTPGYWSPEQADLKPDLQDRRTDVYGLGAVLYAILTGSAPHPTGVPPAEPPNPQDRAAWVDEALAGIARTAMQTRREDRYPTALDLAAAVERWLADQPVLAQRAAVRQLEDRLRTTPNDSVLQEHYARQLLSLGQIYHGMGRSEEGLASFRQAAAQFGGLFQRTLDARFVAERANCLVAEAGCLSLLERGAEAATRAAEATKIYADLIRERPKDYRFNFATIHLNVPQPAASGDTKGETSSHDAGPPAASTDRQGQQTRGGEYEPHAVFKHLWRTYDRSPGITGEPLARWPRDSRIPPSLKYVIRSRIGIGGMGEVYLAEDEFGLRKVAIKRVSDWFLDETSTSLVRRLEFESYLVANLPHPNIITLLQAGGDDDRGYCVYEYIDGLSLREAALDFHDEPQALARSNHEFRKLIAVVATVCEAIAYAHSRGVVHQDPKPQNVLIVRDGRVVVIDWGLGRIVPTVATNPLPLPKPLADLNQKAAAGTPHFMSPEQCLVVTPDQGAGPGVDHRSDIYTLGGTLFFTLTGQTTFPATDTPEQVLQKLVVGWIRRPRQARPGVPSELDAICQKAMSLRPEDRYQSAGEMADALRGWLRG